MKPRISYDLEESSPRGWFTTSWGYKTLEKAMAAARDMRAFDHGHLEKPGYRVVKVTREVVDEVAK